MSHCVFLNDFLVLLASAQFAWSRLCLPAPDFRAVELFQDVTIISRSVKRGMIWVINIPLVVRHPRPRSCRCFQLVCGWLYRCIGAAPNRCNIRSTPSALKRDIRRRIVYFLEFICIASIVSLAVKLREIRVRTDTLHRRCLSLPQPRGTNIRRHVICKIHLDRFLSNLLEPSLKRELLFSHHVKVARGDATLAAFNV